MLFVTGIRQGWKRAFGASLTIVLLAAVAVVGITLFSSEVLAAWKTHANTEQATLQGLLNFEAPAATVSRLNTEKEELDKSQASSDAVLAKNWKFTQNPFLDAIQNLYIQGLQLEFISLFLERVAPNSPLTAFAVSLTQAYLNVVNPFLTSVLHLAPIPVISPSF